MSSPSPRTLFVSSNNSQHFAAPPKNCQRTMVLGLWYHSLFKWLEAFGGCPVLLTGPEEEPPEQGHQCFAPDLELDSAFLAGWRRPLNAGRIFRIG